MKSIDCARQTKLLNSMKINSNPFQIMTANRLIINVNYVKDTLMLDRFAIVSAAIGFN